MAKGTNILKVRDDHEPVYFESEYGDGFQFNLCADRQKPSWLSDKELSVTTLRERIEPWLTSLFQSEHLSLLIGSGLSTAIQNIAVDDPQNVMGCPKSNTKHAPIIEKAIQESVKRNSRGKANIEDYFRVLNDLLRGLEILEKMDDHAELRAERDKFLSEFVSNISATENSIATADEKRRTKAFNNLVSFLMSFASRTGTRDRLNIFTTNYDRVIEAGAELAGLHLLDRFIGTIAPIFRSSRIDIDMHYNPPGIRGEPRYLEGVARFTKLHGSIDWLEIRNEIRRIGLPFGSEKVDSFLKTPELNTDSTHIIYPNASKDRETAEYPYVELFRDFAAALCRPNSTLVTYGYSFGDEHINRIIRDMLIIPSTHLVIVSYDDAQGRIMKNCEKTGRISQISLLIGPALANIEILTDYFLPKPAIDKATFRMSELLEQRYRTNKSEKTSNTHESSAGSTSPK